MAPIRFAIDYYSCVFSAKSIIVFFIYGAASLCHRLISCAFSAIYTIFVRSVVTSRQLRVKVELVGIGDAHIYKFANWQIAARNQHFAVNFG